MKVKCKNCDKEFEKFTSQIKKTKNNFCSRSCSASYNNIGIQRNKPIELKCKRCNIIYFHKRFINTRIFCNECFNAIKNNEFTNLLSEQIKSLTLKHYREKLSVKGKHNSWLNVHVRNFNRSWNKHLLSKPCQVCGYSKHVELCHRKPISSYDENTTLGEINNESNILVLCPNHHWEYDNGDLDI